MTNVKAIIICALLTFAHTPAQSQPEILLKSFSVHENGGQVMLDWTMREGNTCFGINIYRSTDSVNFLKIGEILGVCGSVDYIQRFEFPDSFPAKNTKNYYRLELGGYGFSHTVGVEVIHLGDAAFDIRPHPASGATKIFFKNDASGEFQLTVHNLDGMKMLQQSTRAAFFEVNAGALSQGAYSFTISSERGESFTGIFVVQ